MADRPDGDGADRVSFELTIDDLWRFNLHLLLHEPRVRRIALRNLLAGPVLAFVVLLVVFPADLVTSALIALATLPFAAAVIAVRIRWGLRTKAAESASDQGRWTVIAEHGRIREHTPVGARAVPWREVRDVRETRRHLFVVYGPSRGTPIPKDAFASQGQARAFAEMLRSRVDDAR